MVCYALDWIDRVAGFVASLASTSLWYVPIANTQIYKIIIQRYIASSWTSIFNVYYSQQTGSLPYHLLLFSPYIARIHIHIYTTPPKYKELDWYHCSIHMHNHIIHINECLCWAILLSTPRFTTLVVVSFVC